MRRLVPGITHADAHVERNVHLDRRAHLTTDEILDLVALARRDLQHQLVVHLQQHP